MKAKHIYWILCAGVFAVGILAAAASPWLTYTFNLTHSLPGTLYVIHKHSEVKKGDLIAYRWHGGATYPVGTIFIKQVAGVAGDTVRREGVAFWVDGQYIGIAKPFSKAGLPLQPAQEGVIAAGEYFVATVHPNSLDSRYALTGNVKLAAIIGKAYAIF